MSDADELWLEVGKLTKPHGLNGAFLYKPYSGSLNSTQANQPIRVTRRDGVSIDASIAAIRPYKKGAIIQLTPTPETLDALRGAVIAVQRVDLEPLADDEMYVADLLGMTAVLPDGAIAGKVTDAVDTGAVTSLVIEGPCAGTVPYHDDWVGDPDTEQKVLPLKQSPIS